MAADIDPPPKLESELHQFIGELTNPLGRG